VECLFTACTKECRDGENERHKHRCVMTKTAAVALALSALSS
jgi:hypothetical protein